MGHFWDLNMTGKVFIIQTNYICEHGNELPMKLLTQCYLVGFKIEIHE